MQGVIRDKGCPKAHCLKRPTSAVSVCFLFVRVVFLFTLLIFMPNAPIGLWTTRIEVLEYWFPAPLPEGDPGKDAAAPAELRQPAEEEAEFSSDSSVGSEPELEITVASGPPPSAALRRKTRRIVKKIQLSKAGLAAAQQTLRSSTQKGASKIWGASAHLATAEVGSVSAGPQVEKEAAQVLGQLCREVTPPRVGSRTPPAAPPRLKFPLHRSGG